MEGREKSAREWPLARQAVWMRMKGWGHWEDRFGHRPPGGALGIGA